jgi:hypothetical protein
MLKKLFVTALLFVATPAFANENVGPFKITSMAVYNPGNMSVRIFGMTAMTSCPAGAGWAYVDENDPGSKTKIAVILAAYTAGKNVRLSVSGVNFFSNGDLYCSIASVGVEN